MNKKFLLEILKASKTKPKYFGLGFIQCKINDKYRAHFYHPDISPIVNIKEEIHDHRYNFTSYVVTGNIKNNIYRFSEDINGKYFKQFETCSPDNKLDHVDKIFGNVELISSNIIHENQNYFMDHTWFHTIETSRCVTLLSRSEYKKELSNVIRPKDSNMICPFSKSLDEAYCWEIIEDLLCD